MHNDLGVALAIAGRLEEALQHYEEAVQLNPDFAEAQRNRARARAALSGH
jgi:tetratricopeptide (TPR) repeat protein